MLALQDISYRHRDGATVALPDWEAADGAQWAITGPSGSGKSTLLHILAGLLRPASGHVVVGGQNLGHLDEPALDRFRGRHVGLVFQTLHLVGALTVSDNLRLSRYFAQLPRDEDRIRGVLERLDITAVAHRYPRTLGHDQAQRAAIARAVVNEPTVLLADEPTSALDDHHCAQVLTLLIEQARESGATLVIATHDVRVREHVQHTLDLGTAA